MQLPDSEYCTKYIKEMKRILILFIFGLSAIDGSGQGTTGKNALSLHFGPAFIARQDLVFSPFIHGDFSFLNIGAGYTRKAKLFQKVNLRFANFNPMVAEPYEFAVHGENYTAYPHSLSLIDLDYQLGKRISENQRSVITAGGLYSTDIQALNYVYGRIGSFGYYSAFGLGIFGTYERPVSEKSHLAATLQLPLIAWLARSPYLVNDDEFIENISSHSGLKTFMAFIGDGEFVSWNKMQTLDLELKYEYSLNERWGLSAAFQFDFVHVSQPRNLLSFRNSLDFSACYKF